MDESTRRTLELVVERANTLRERNYANLFREVGFGFRATRTESGSFETKFDMPDEKDRNDTLVTLRQFTSDKDDISFTKLKKLLKHRDLSPAWKDSIRQVCREYDRYLDGYPENVEEDFFFPGDHPTRREVFGTVMGFIFHSQMDNPKLMNYKQWTRDEVRAAVLEQVFNRIILRMLYYINQLAELSEQELRESNS